MQQRMISQVTHGSNGEARTTSRGNALGQKPVSVEIGVGARPVSDGDVHSVVSEVDKGVGRVQSQVATGMRGTKVCKPWHEPLRYESGRSREREYTDRMPTADLVDGFGERVKAITKHR